jgi:gas vesicle protein
MAIGTLAGLAIAPQPGDRTREQLRDAARGVKSGLEATGRAVQRVTPVVAPVAENALHVVELVRRRRSDDDLNGDGVANSPMQTPTG